MSGAVSSTVATAAASFKAWLDEPFTTPLDTTQIFLIVGIVAVSIVLWNMILFHVRIAAQEVV